ncbi:hypothetical protein D3C73_874100 [compost metagenome]
MSTGSRYPRLVCDLRVQRCGVDQQNVRVFEDRLHGERDGTADVAEQELDILAVNQLTRRRHAFDRNALQFTPAASLISLMASRAPRSAKPPKRALAPAIGVTRPIRTSSAACEIAGSIREAVQRSCPRSTAAFFRNLSLAFPFLISTRSALGFSSWPRFMPARSCRLPRKNQLLRGKILTRSSS